MLIEARRTGPEDGPDKIKRRILEKQSHRGVQMEFGLDSEGDPIRPLILHKIKDGKFRAASVP